MTAKKQPESPAVFGPSVNLDWFQVFLKHLEINLIETCQHLSSAGDSSAYRLVALRAVKLTLLDSGMDEHSMQSLFGKVAFEKAVPESEGQWTAELNRRRFELIDLEIQGSLNSTEKLELVALTQQMRAHVDSEANLPTNGAKALHRLLLNSDLPDVNP